MRNKCYLKYLFILLSISISACALLPGIPLTGNLSDDKLVGSWKLTYESMVFLKNENIKYKDQEIKLTLSDDHTFRLSNIPDCWINDFGRCLGEHYSFEGEWKINQREDSYVDLWLSDKSSTHAIPLIKRTNIIQIPFYFGDPDSGRVIYFTKQ
jgi:hypothetical protein